MAQTKPMGKQTPKKTTSKSVKPALPKLAVTLDKRTENMSTAILRCRGRFHPWQEVPTESELRAELAAQYRVCVTEFCLSCKSARRTVYEVTGAIVGKAKIEYSDDYLIDKQYAGTGRIDKQESRKAWIASLYSELVTVS